MTKKQQLDDVIGSDAEWVSRQIYSDPDLYRLELGRVFSRSWLYLGHVSQIAQPGDFITTWMAEDPIILVRDNAGAVTALLNSCRHRGMRVCRTDHGNARAFRCSYHGWTYSNSGSLTVVPQLKEAYHRELDRSRGLVRVPRVESYRGFVFGNWDAEAENLASALGDYKWYIDLLTARCLGEFQVSPSVQRYRLRANWKLPADNFAGDMYHVSSTHASVIKLGMIPPNEAVGAFCATFPGGHAMSNIPRPRQRFEIDMQFAQTLGSPFVDYVTALQLHMRQHVEPLQADIWALGEGTIFPNFSWVDEGSLLSMTLLSWHPRGPREIEVWVSSGFDSAAPPPVRQLARSFCAQAQAAAGLIGQDDVENLEQVSAATLGHISSSLRFDFTMARGIEQPNEFGLPGRLQPHYTEAVQRNFYGRWRELMSASDGSQQELHDHA